MSRRSRHRRVAALVLRPLRALRRDDGGTALIEFAFVAAIMVFMYLGSTQLSDAVNANRRVTITARAMADLASRTPSDVGSRIGELKESQLTTIIAAAGKVLHPYNMQNAKVRVSEVWKCAVPRNRASNPTYDPAHASFNLAKCLPPYDSTRPTDPENLADSTATPVVGVQWSRTNNNGLSPLTAAQVALPASIQVGTILIQADVSYRHDPWFAGFNFGTMNLSETIFMVPRNSRTVQLVTG
jgi:Flp pilus assembly protein TadG